MKHTKLPWKVAKTALNAISVRAKGGGRVCEIINDDAATLTPRMEDNAAFIAHAANCHEELMGALKDIVTQYDDGTPTAGGWQMWNAKAAINKAEGRP